MPNNVMNVLTFKDSEIAEKAFDFMGASEGLFDFERICPIPPYVWRGDVSDTIARIFGAKMERHGNTEFVYRYESGDTWLPWCSEHWGTKWNSYRFERVDANTIRFETAWSPVPRIILLLAHKFKAYDFVYEWADEDFGNNSGGITGENRSDLLHIDVYTPENQTKAAFEIAARVRPEYVKTDENDEGFYWDEESGRLEYFEPEEV